MDPASEGRAATLLFHGSWRDYGPIWLRNILFQPATLGIYASWAQARDRRYFWGATSGRRRI